MGCSYVCAVLISIMMISAIVFTIPAVRNGLKALLATQVSAKKLKFTN